MKLIPLRSPGIKLLLLSLMHFATDGLCAYLVFSKLYPENPALAVMVFFGYNILAFVTQSPIGLLIDKYNKPKLFLAISVLAMLFGYLFSSVWFLSVFFIGVSNSVFHVAGGNTSAIKAEMTYPTLVYSFPQVLSGLYLGRDIFHLHRCHTYSLLFFLPRVSLCLSRRIVKRKPIPRNMTILTAQPTHCLL